MIMINGIRTKTIKKAAKEAEKVYNDKIKHIKNGLYGFIGDESKEIPKIKQKDFVKHYTQNHAGSHSVGYQYYFNMWDSIIKYLVKNELFYTKKDGPICICPESGKRKQKTVEHMKVKVANEIKNHVKEIIALKLKVSRELSKGTARRGKLLSDDVIGGSASHGIGKQNKTGRGFNRR